MSKFNSALAEKPLRTGVRRRSRGDGRFLDRKALRREVSFLELMGVKEADQYRRPGFKKPYQNTTCPGEWRYFTVRALHMGSETLFSNEKARTILEAKRKIEKAFEVKVLEVRQQDHWMSDNEVDSWFGSEIQQFEISTL